MDKKENSEKKQLIVAAGIFVSIVLIGVCVKLFSSKSAAANTQLQQTAELEVTTAADRSFQDDSSTSQAIAEESSDENEDVHEPNDSERTYEESDEEGDEQRLLAHEYILPFSDSQYYSEEDLDQLTREQLRIARNEIYARRGRKFKDKQLQDYFEGCSWYQGTTESDQFDDKIFNTYENANKDLISQYEEKKGYR